MAIQINGNGTITGISVGGLPDGIVDTDMIAANAVTSAKSTGLGISMVDEWRTYNTQSVNGNTATTINSWERNDNTFSQIGSGMTQSNGLFTFPQTGIYFILGNFSFFDTSGDNRYITPRAYWNSTYITQVYTSLKYVSGETFSTVSTPFILDVTSTSPTLHFSVVSENNFQITGNNWAGVGNENVNTCSVTFIRLGDT
jgi:hypothetical protein